MSAKIIISREKGFLNGNGGVLAIFIDGKEVDLLINKTTFFVEPGVYTVQVKMRYNLIKTQLLIVNATEIKEVYLTVKNGVKYYSFFQFLIIISLVGNLFFTANGHQVPSWYSKLSIFLIIAFSVYLILTYLYKKGGVKILQETIRN